MKIFRKPLNKNGSAPQMVLDSQEINKNHEIFLYETQGTAKLPTLTVQIKW